MHEYQFSTDWTEGFIANASVLFYQHRNRPTDYLEIGMYEGRSACWMLDEILVHPASTYTGVEHTLRPVVMENLRWHEAKTAVYVGDSKVVLPNMHKRFDIIYIDGDHSARGVLFDSVNAWLRLKVHGIILWDDYKIGSGCEVPRGVGSFLDCMPKNHYRKLLENSQFAVRKLKE